MNLFNKKGKFEDLEFPEFIEINFIKYFIEVEFIKKKSSSVSIKENKLKFRLSSYLSKSLAQKHFAELLKNIYRKLEKSNVHKKELFLIDNVLEEGFFKFAGEIYKIEQTSKVRSVKLENNIFYVNYKVNKDLIQKYLIRFLIERYSQRVKEYVKKINEETFNFSIKDVELKYVSSKWGHCTFDNKIMLNLKLLNADIKILDYVIIHELAHIKVKDHSANFWTQVFKYVPEYKKLRMQLKKNSPQLFCKVEVLE